MQYTENYREKSSMSVTVKQPSKRASQILTLEDLTPVFVTMGDVHSFNGQM